MTKQPKKPNPQKDYEQLGRMLESLYETSYANKRSLYKMSFIKGVIGGFGGVIGATVVVAIVAWILSLLHFVPFVHTITDNFQSTMSKSQEPQQNDSTQP